MTWNNWPRTKVGSIQMRYPLAASISPIRPHTDISTLPYPPFRCKTCTSVLNCFSRVGFNAKIWICSFCYQRNPSLGIIMGSLRPISQPSCIRSIRRLEYTIGGEHQNPENGMVGFVSFGTQVQVHEQGFSDMSKVCVFRGTKVISKDQAMEKLGLVGTGRRNVPVGGVDGYQQQKGVPMQNSGVTWFLLPASEREFTLKSEFRLQGYRNGIECGSWITWSLFAWDWS